MTTRHRRRAERAGLWLLIAALHLALLYGLNGAGPSRWRAWLVPEPGLPLLVRLIDNPPAPQPAAPQATAAPSARSRAAPAPAPAFAPELARTPAAAPQAITAAPEPVETSPAARAASTPSVTQALDLRLPRRADAASAPRSMREQILNDPRSNSPRATLESRIAEATGGDDSKVIEEQMGEGRMRIRKGSRCVEVHTARQAQIEPFNPGAQAIPKQVKSCK